MNGTQRKTLEECIVCGKGTSLAEAMSKSEKNQARSLAIVELHESECIRQAGS